MSRRPPRATCTYTLVPYTPSFRSPDGRGLVAISDEGRWLSAARAYDADGNGAGLTAARCGPLHDAAGRLLSVSIKRRQDAEALARLPDGSLLVAFERE